MKSVLTIFLNPDISMLQVNVILANQLPTSWIMIWSQFSWSIFLLDILPFSFVVFILSTVTIMSSPNVIGILCPVPSSVLPSLPWLLDNQWNDQMQLNQLKINCLFMLGTNFTTALLKSIHTISISYFGFLKLYLFFWRNLKIDIFSILQ